MNDPGQPILFLFHIIVLSHENTVAKLSSLQMCVYSLYTYDLYIYEHSLCYKDWKAYKE